MAAVSENSKALGTSVGTGSHLIKVPLCFQETEYTCGVACVQSVLAGYGIVYRQDVLADILKTRPVYGTDYQNILRFLQMLGFQAAFHYDMNIDMIKEYIKNGVTPMLMIQAWKGDAIDYRYDWRDSHYVLSCGYEEHRLLFMDPYTLGNYTYLSDFELMKRWHTIDSLGNHYSNTGIIIRNENLPYRYSSQSIRHME